MARRVFCARISPCYAPVLSKTSSGADFSSVSRNRLACNGSGSRMQALGGAAQPILSLLPGQNRRNAIFERQAQLSFDRTVLQGAFTRMEPTLSKRDVP